MTDWETFWGNHSCAEEICPTCQGRVRQLIKENERLKEELEDARLYSEVEMESMREDETKTLARLLLDLPGPAHSVVALAAHIADLQARLSAAEAVVEAAKDHQTHPDARLMRTIRQYERAKKDVTPGKDSQG